MVMDDTLLSHPKCRRRHLDSLPVQQGALFLTTVYLGGSSLFRAWLEVVCPVIASELLVKMNLAIMLNISCIHHVHLRLCRSEQCFYGIIESKTQRIMLIAKDL